MTDQNLSVGSTGTRVLMTLVGICLDERFTTILIDEPELGLSPKLQETLACIFQNEAIRREQFPHLKHIVIATHSHIFLDRSEPQNNYVVSKAENVITLQQVQTINAFHRLQFNLLGNSLELMFSPSAIVVVEGAF